MSSYQISQSSARSFSSLLRFFQCIEGLPFTNVLTKRDIQKAFDDADCHFAENEDDVFAPAITL